MLDGTLLSKCGVSPNIEDSIRWASLVFNTVRAGIVIVDAGTHEIKEANTSAALILGISRDKLMGAHCGYRLCGVSSDDKCAMLLAGGYMDEGEFELTRDDGSTFYILKNASTVIWDEKKYFVETFVDITELKKLECEKLNYNNILKAGNNIAARLLEAYNWELAINDVLSVLGKSTNVSRVYLFKIFENNSNLIAKQLYEWSALGVKPELSNKKLQNFDFMSEGFSRWLKTFRSHGLINGIVPDLPLSEQDILLAKDIKSVLALPLFVEGCLWGFIGFDDCVSYRLWSDVEVGALGIISNIISIAIERDALLEKNRVEDTKTWITVMETINKEMNSVLKQETGDRSIRKSKQDLFKALTMMEIIA